MSSSEYKIGLFPLVLNNWLLHKRNVFRTQNKAFSFSSQQLVIAQKECDQVWHCHVVSTVIHLNCD